MQTHLALLRGINVGGKNKLAMNVLSDMFTQEGCKDVRTFIQSGNVIFQAPASLAERVPDTVAAQIAKAFGYRIPIVLRTRDQLQTAILQNPFVLKGIAEETLHLMFLAHKPTTEQVSALDKMRSQPDEFVVLGRDIYLRLPNGVARSKLTNAYFDAKLSTVSTMRNWRTVGQLLKLMSSVT